MSASAEYLQLARLPSKELERIVRGGERPDVDELVGWEFRGTNTPGWARYAGIRKFLKGFARGEEGVFGYNVRAVQNPLEGPWTPDPKRPERFGFFRVSPVDPAARDHAYPNALLLDYGAGRNPRLSPTRSIRDYLVRVEAGSDDLLLGRAYTALGPLRVPVSFFVLARHGRASGT
jgi:hypothetical protein